MTAIALQHKDQIIERIAQGKRLSDISTELGLDVSRQAMSIALKADGNYRKAYEIGLEAVLDRLEVQLEGAEQQIDVSRTRELLAQARWRCEREFPERWGGKAAVQINVGLVLNQDQVSSISDIIGAATQQIEHKQE